jgi:hypothetical protein
MREALADIRATSLDMAVVRSEALPSMRETHSERDIERQPFDKELAGGEREALESQAAALIASNDFRSALSRYQALSALYPDDETLRDVIVVLRAKLRCDPSADFGSGACR